METARAILETAAENMADAIRLMTVERGIDHRDYALIAFGGAGPLHAVDVAAPLEMKKVVVPPHPGLCSALGTLLTDLRVDRARTVNHRSDSADLATCSTASSGIARPAQRWRSSSARGSKARRGSPATSACATWARTSASWCSSRRWSSTTDSFARALESLHRQHEELYGYALRDKVVEMTEVRVIAVGEERTDVDAERARLRAPAGRMPIARSISTAMSRWRRRSTAAQNCLLAA